MPAPTHIDQEAMRKAIGASSRPPLWKQKVTGTGRMRSTERRAWAD